MRKPKHRLIRSHDGHRHAFKSHRYLTELDNEVTIDVCELENGEGAGTIVIDIEKVVGSVEVRYGDGTQYKILKLPSRARGG